MSRQKSARILTLGVHCGAFPQQVSRTVRVRLVDEREPDRVQEVMLTVWEAQRLAAQLLTAVRLLPDPQDAP